jgi:hypothetical protein
MTRTLRVAVVGLLGCLIAPAARAAGVTVVLLPPTGDNVAPGILQAAGELFKDHLLRTGAYDVIEAPQAGAPPTVEPTPQQAATAAQTMGAAQAIVVRITHFGSSARVRVTAYAASTGQVVYWDSIAVTGGPDELDTTFQRLAHAMETGRPVRDSAEIDTVSDKEMQGLGRRQANKVFGLHILELMPFTSAGTSFGTVTGGGLFWLYDARSWMADVAVDLGFGSDSRDLFSLAIGGYYPFSREDFTPYLGGLARWAYMNLGGNGNGGISLQPTFGILLGRLSTVQLRADVGYFFNLFGEYTLARTAQGDLVAAGGRHYGQGAVLTVGIGF